jgi:glycosyltransferase involved in cell wall biosynthesis
MQNELVSIIYPSFTPVPFIAAAIASVQAQTHADWELIIDVMLL